MKENKKDITELEKMIASNDIKADRKTNDSSKVPTIDPIPRRRRGKENNIVDNNSTNKKSKKKSSKKGKNNNKPKKSKNKKLTIVAIILLVIALIGGFLYYTKWVVPAKNSLRPLSFLMVGVDNNQFREDTHDGANKNTEAGQTENRTDSLMVATFDPETYKVVMTSIPRDTSIDYICDDIPDIRDQVNLIYWASESNIDCLVDSVENFLNIPIDYHVMVDMDQFTKVIDEVGGIEIEAHAANGSFCQANPDQASTYCFNDGETYTMTGEEALNYSRFRKDSEADYGRGLRQQQVMKATASKILSDGLNIKVISTIYDMVNTNVELKLAYDYFMYVDEIMSLTNMVAGTEEVKVDTLDKKAWKAVAKIVDIKLGSNFNQEDVVKVIEKLKKEYTAEELSNYLFTTHQFYNTGYGGWYVTDEEARYEISNSLRKNLGLKEEPIKEYEFPFGVVQQYMDFSGGSIQYTTETIPTDKKNITCKSGEKGEDTDSDGYYDKCVKGESKPDVQVEEEKPEVTDPVIDVPGGNNDGGTSGGNTGGGGNTGDGGNAGGGGDTGGGEVEPPLPEVCNPGFEIGSDGTCTPVETPKTCPAGTTHYDDNTDGLVDEGECRKTPKPCNNPGEEWDDELGYCVPGESKIKKINFISWFFF